MSARRRLRTKFDESPMRLPQPGGRMMRVMRAIREDGQPFGTWMPEQEGPTPAKVRTVLDEMLDDPALPILAHADEQKKARYRVYGKGKEGWIEEPEPEGARDE